MVFTSVSLGYIYRIALRHPTARLIHITPENLTFFKRHGMDLATIVKRFATALTTIDREDTRARANRRTGELYRPGLPAMSEREVTTAFCKWWRSKYPEDFPQDHRIEAEVRYPLDQRARCDFVIRDLNDQVTWAVEVKKISLVGDNGKGNDFGVTKMLSPYLKDRSLRHDLLRLKDSGLAGRAACIVYGFSYSAETVAYARHKFVEEATRIANLDRVRDSARDANGVYSLEPLTDIAQLMFDKEKLTTNVIRKEFSGAWTHPCGGNGLVVGWEVAR
ncbi:MAG: hypothetical protein ACK5TE_03270 [Pseudomonadota bacterium]